jgi:hypothetical protein
MKSRLTKIKKYIELAEEQPVYSVAAKAMHFKKALVETEDLLEIMVVKIEHLERTILSQGIT